MITINPIEEIPPVTLGEKMKTLRCLVNVDGKTREFTTVYTREGPLREVWDRQVAAADDLTLGVARFVVQAMLVQHGNRILDEALEAIGKITGVKFAEGWVDEDESLKRDE